jgi:hypothetical protein
MTSVPLPDEVIDQLPGLEDPAVFEENPGERGWYPENFAPRPDQN